MMLACAAFAGARGADISALQGRWNLEAIDGKSIAPSDEAIFFEITGQTITGYDGCNRFGGSVDRIQAGQRGCPSGVARLPLDFSDARSQLDRATVSDDRLVLPLPDGSGEAEFRRSGGSSGSEAPK